MPGEGLGFYHGNVQTHGSGAPAAGLTLPSSTGRSAGAQVAQNEPAREIWNALSEAESQIEDLKFSIARLHNRLVPITGSRNAGIGQSSEGKPSPVRSQIQERILGLAEQVRLVTSEINSVDEALEI